MDFTKHARSWYCVSEFVEQLAPTKVLLMPDGQEDYFNESWLELVTLA